jgi:flagellar basal body-associated protein FliL
MIQQSIAIYNWSNGVIMIAIFAVVCLTLIGILVNFMMSGKKKDSENDSADSL